MKSIPLNLSCPRCFSKNLYKFGKDKEGNQKFQCKSCKRQWAPDAKPFKSKYPSCPKCGKTSFLHHDYKLYSNFRCNDRKNCNHSFFVVKLVEVPPTSSKDLKLESFTMKRMRHPFHIVLTALVQYFIGNSTFRKVAETLYLTNQVKVSHVTISKWCKRFAPALFNVTNRYKDQINVSDSDEWHFDETYIKIKGKWYYLWLAIDSETRMILDFHLSPYRDATSAFSLIHSCQSQYGTPQTMFVSDRYPAYRQAFEKLLPEKIHLRVEDFADNISNNVIEAFNGQFKAWYKTKRGFQSFESANTLIALYIFFYNFIRPHQSLSKFTPAQVAGAKYSEKTRLSLLLIS
ncbi:MAG: IS6 family transposase [Clostridiaceae bacterium]|nr:IS6 family transposase [Clostridiaceae bacterium]